MIPKIIHYCWFGGNPIPVNYQCYIDSWRRLMPDYQIIQWDEKKFDVKGIPFTAEAYEKKKYAYVSDYARLKILYENGGVYFDTDVEMVKPIYDILERGAWMAFEKNVNAPEAAINVNPGLGFACEAGNPIIREIMEYYENNHYVLSDGTLQQIPIVPITTNVLKRHGLQLSDIPLQLNNITIYPWEYFCPIEYLSNKCELTYNTRTIHHYAATWMNFADKMKMKKGYWITKIKRFLKHE